MSTSCNQLGDAEAATIPLFYRQVASLPDFGVRFEDAEAAKPRPEPGLSVEEMEKRLKQARGEAAAEAERRLRNAHEEKLASMFDQIGRAVEQFGEERRSYFARVEAELVRLALSIAARILHREAQVDPLLVAALVRIAIEKMRDGSSVTVRVAAVDAAGWRTRLGAKIGESDVEIVEDDQLGPQECVLETRLGSVEFGIEAQLKEIERGFFDLLAHRPEIK
jgi:flagellar assembly protein FliH